MLEVESDRICETEDLEAGEDHLRLTSRKNGYPEKFIARAMIPRTKQKVLHADGIVTEASNPRKKTLCILTYEKGTSDKIADICRKAGVQPVLQEKTTLRGLLTRVKGPHAQGCGVPDPLCTV